MKIENNKNDIRSKLRCDRNSNKKTFEKTIISTRQILLCITLRIKRGLRLHESTRDSSNFPTTEEMNSEKEMEGVLNAYKIIAVLSKYERTHVTARGIVVKSGAYQQLCANK